MISCRTLGPVEILVDGAPAPPELLWRKNLALLIYLARSPKARRNRDHLMALLWGDKPESSARHSLREAIRVVRKAVGNAVLSADGDVVKLDPRAVRLDVDEFLERAANADWPRAVQLFAGDFLEGFGVPDASPFEDWLLAERAQWRTRGVAALVQHAGQLSERGLVGEAVIVATRAHELEPGSDATARCLLRNLALAGDRGGALRCYDRFLAHLQRLGAQPEQETEALADRVRRERQWHLSGEVPQHAEDGAESRRAPLIGREAVLLQLTSAWHDARAGGRAAILLVTGDTGCGTTRLLEELETRARLAGTVTARMRAVPADADHPYTGLLTLARGGLLEAPGIGAAPPAALAALGLRLVEWADRFPVRKAEPLPLPSALYEVLHAALEEGPILLVVDDAQWLDVESARALEALLRDVGNQPCTLLVGARAHPPHPVLDDLRSRIGRELRGAVVDVPPLDLTALSALTEWAVPAFDEDARARLARRLLVDTAGLPLLAVEILHAVALGLDLGTIAGAWPDPQRTLDQTLPGDLPDAVRAAIRTGFRRLSANAQRLLCATALAPRPADAALLQRATGLEPVELEQALDEAEWQRWLQVDPRGYDFVARILGDVIEQDMLTAGQRQRLRAALDATS